VDGARAPRPRRQARSLAHGAAMSGTITRALDIAAAVVAAAVLFAIVAVVAIP
jgi:hypothetical protein